MRTNAPTTTKITFAAALLALFGLFVATEAHADKRAAIVVGNGDYPFAPLPNPHSDAKLIANTLTELNFDVLLFYDVKKTAIKDLKDAIKTHLTGADMAVFYYAGHALQAEGQNLLLPVDTRTTSAREVIADSMKLNDLIDLGEIGAVRLGTSSVRFDPNIDFVGPPDGYGLLGAGAGVEFPAEGRLLRLSLVGTNLLNVRYRDYTSLLRYFADEPGWGVQLRFSAEFDASLEK